MLHQIMVAAPTARRFGITLAICIGTMAAGHASPNPPAQLPTSYCAYEVGPNLTVEAINNRNQIVGTAAVTDLIAEAFVWDLERGVRLLGMLPGAAISVGFDINDHGQAVGYSGGGQVQQQAFIWDERNGMRRIIALGGRSASALYINNTGQILGLSSTRDEDGEHMFFRDRRGEVVDLGGGILHGLNDFGQIVFSTQTQQPPVVSTIFLWDPRKGEQRLGGFPENRFIFPGAINNNLDIVGAADRDDQFSHAMRWTLRKGMQFIDPPYEETFSFAAGVNELGHVVGYTAAGGLAPFIWTEQEGSRDLSTMIDPTSPTVPQAQTIAPRAINDHGWIAINAHNFDGTDRHVYVLAPKFADDPTPCAPSERS